MPLDHFGANWPRRWLPAKGHADPLVAATMVTGEPTSVDPVPARNTGTVDATV